MTGILRIAVVCIGSMGLMLAFTGCVQKTAGLEVTGTVMPTGEGKGDLARVVLVHSPKLGRQVEAVDARHEWVGDLLKASVTLMSKVDTTLRIQYRFVWYNAEGLEEDLGGDAWTPLVLHGRESRTVQAVAPNASVRTFQVRVRF